MLQGFTTGNAWSNFINAQNAGHKYLDKGLSSIGKAVSDQVKLNEAQKLKDIKDAKDFELKQAQGAFMNAQGLAAQATTDQERLQQQQVMNGLMQEYPELLSSGFAGKAQDIYQTDPDKSLGFKHVTVGDTVYLYDANTGQLVNTIKNDTPNDSITLDPKFIRDVNTDVNKYIGKTKEITSAAKSLENLQLSSSAASQVAAIFKFMKALDPTSVVREGEQEMARRTGGITDYFMGFIDQIRGKGGLRPDVFTDLVNTAKNLAKTRQISAYKDVNDYLSTYGDAIDQNFSNKILNLVPQNYADFKIMQENDPDAEVIQTIRLPDGTIIEELAP